MAILAIDDHGRKAVRHARRPMPKMLFIKVGSWPRAACATERRKWSSIAPDKLGQMNQGTKSGTSPSMADWAWLPVARRTEKNAEAAGMNLHGKTTRRHLGASGSGDSCHGMEGYVELEYPCVGDIQKQLTACSRWLA